MQNDQVEPKKLKPVTFISGTYRHHSQNTTQQIMLLKALKITQDPKKLKELIGVRTVSEVYRTLDKMAMRKEYHDALARNGISFDYMVEGLKKEIDNTENKSGDRIKAIQTLMRSIGMDKYEQDGVIGGNWEDALLKTTEELGSDEVKTLPSGDYEVIQPKMPKSLKKTKDKEKSEGLSLYE